MKYTLKQALDVVANTQASEDDVHDALHALRDGIEQLEHVERAALEVAQRAQSDPIASRYLVPAHTFDVMRRRLEPIHRPVGTPDADQ